MSRVTIAPCLSPRGDGSRHHACAVIARAVDDAFLMLRIYDPGCGCLGPSDQRKKNEQYAEIAYCSLSGGVVVL